MIKSYKFDIDDWVLYAPYLDFESELLNKERQKVIILEILENDSLYDYRIYIDDTGRMKRIKQENLFPIIDDITTY
jgi:hypothetical protein